VSAAPLIRRRLPSTVDAGAAASPPPQQHPSSGLCRYHCPSSGQHRHRISPPSPKTPSKASLSLSFELLSSLASNPSLQGPTQAPARLDPPPSPFPFIAFVGSVVATAFPSGFTVAATFPVRPVVPLAGSLSSWLNSSLSWPSRPDPSTLFYSAAGAATLTSAVVATLAVLLGHWARKETRRYTFSLLLSFLRRPADR
jgi:hypothetical protein